MKNLTLSFLLAFCLPIFLQAQYSYSVDIADADPCCISIEMKAWDPDLPESSWEVVVDGTTSYTFANDGNEFLHCVEGNGTHTVVIYINGEVAEVENIAVTGCIGDCTVCDIKRLEPVAYQLDGCRYWMDFDFMDQTGTGPYSSECHTPTYFWDFGDGTTSTDYPAFHDFPEDGTYTACLTFTLTNPNGGICSVSKCIEVVVEGCTPPFDCCENGLEEIEVRTAAPWNPCLFRLGPGRHTVFGNCGEPIYEWDLDGDGVTDYTGKYYIGTYGDIGPHTACLTMSYPGGDCEVEVCTTFSLPGCDGLVSGGPGRERSAGVDMDGAFATQLEVYPNPATDNININIAHDVFSPTELLIVKDTNGKVMNAQRLNNEANSSMDISKFPAGSYFIQAIGTDGVLQTERFVKTK